MSITRKIKRVVRGEVKPKTVVLEAMRRAREARRSVQERSRLVELNVERPQLTLEKTPHDLVEHFRTRSQPNFFPGFSSNSTPQLQRDLFPKETAELLSAAGKIVETHTWPLLGFGPRNFGDEIEWRRDPLSQHLWSLEYHRDIQLIRNDGSDARVLWELNRLGHFLTLARAYVVSGDERFSEECFSQLQSWATQNPYGRGVNWNCAMEVALRAMNLLVVFELLKHSRKFDHEVLSLFLRLFHQHGTYIVNNSEFSYVSTSNHYLSDLAGLLWLGVMLPEFVESNSWRTFALREMLVEMDKQILPDGADFESSTGYHRFIVELFLFSFILCKLNKFHIDETYWDKLKLMLSYMRGYLRPDGLAPLIGDSDSGQALPLRQRRADEHSHVLAIGSALFRDANFKMCGSLPEELLWILGAEGVETLNALENPSRFKSEGFSDTGTYVMREGELYLCVNTSDAGLNGRGSHGHNDALSIEVFAFGQPFIVDPGTYVYSADLKLRHRFRSTAFHSTVMIDGEEQSTTLESIPFVIGNEARPRVLEWNVTAEFDRIVAEHYGYKRLANPIVHRRTITFDKRQKEWLIEDVFVGEGEHEYEVRFHFAPHLRLTNKPALVTAEDRGVRLVLSSLDLTEQAELETQATSRDYGEKTESITACWRTSGRPGKLSWRIQVSQMSDML